MDDPFIESQTILFVTACILAIRYFKWTDLKKRRRSASTLEPCSLFIMTYLVGIFSCASISAPTADYGFLIPKGAVLVFKYFDILRSFILALVLTLGQVRRIPYLLFPWLLFTLKSMVLVEIPTVLSYWSKLSSNDGVSPVLFLWLVVFISVQQLSIWLDVFSLSRLMWRKVTPVSEENSSVVQGE